MLALAWQYFRSGALLQAEQGCRQVLEADPHCGEAWYLLGLVRQAAGSAADAEYCYQQALLLQPDFHEAHFSLGNALVEQGRLGEAAARFREVLRLHPQHAKAWGNLGVMLAEQGQFAEALACYDRAVEHEPDFPEAHYNHGNALRELRRFEEAVTQYESALALKPAFAEAHLNLGIARDALGDLAGSLAEYRRALALRPAYLEALNAVGLALAQFGQLEEALTYYEKALQLHPNFADAHNNRALVWLALGDFGRGWPEYEWRWQLPGIGQRSFAQPRWDGAPLAGRTILLYAEQGLGDTMHFVRYAPLVKNQGGIVLVECQPSLVPLLSSCRGIDQLIPRGSALPAFDVQAPLMSLPGILGVISAEVPYLHVNPQRIERWRAELGEDGSFKIGIAWQGSAGYRWDRQRSIPLHYFGRLASIPGVRLYSLQKGPGSEQLASLAGSFPVEDLASRLDEASAAFVETAAVLHSLDLVISCDSAVAHLAGAMARPVWLALPVGSDWRWQRERSDSPWYPTARLFRQRKAGEWEQVFDEMAAALLEASGHRQQH